MSDFNKIAPFYDPLVKTVFGNTLTNAEKEYLDRIPPGSNVLIVGGGTGKMLEWLNKSAPGSEITFVDSSSAMINRAKARQADQLSIDFVNASIFNVHGNRFDYVITPFILDLFADDELGALVEHLHGFLEKGGQWLFTDFIRSESIVNKLVTRVMYWFFGRVSDLKSSQLPNYGKWFSEYSMTLDSQKDFSNGLVSSRVYLKK